ncbi:unnamed protein product [Lactuca saligna]|uniref:Uncharacterized protein n=1 Tax=Lactuca saligna TaxID=75948 RepID=A0AA35YDC9_LACSI|nr:unnamed protein product [Lactuca saligna]
MPSSRRFCIFPPPTIYSKTNLHRRSPASSSGPIHYLFIDDLHPISDSDLFFIDISQSALSESATVKWGLNLIEKLIQCKDVSSNNWCEYIIDCLEKSKNKWRPNDKNWYFTGPLAFLMMVYADRVICKDVNLQRYRPFIIEIDSENLRVLEEYEVSKWIFGSLSLWENVDGVFYDEMMIQDDSRNRSVEGSYGLIASMVGRLLETKKIIKASPLVCIEMHLNDDKRKAVIKKVVEIFNRTTLKELLGNGHEDRIDVDVISVHETE